MVKQGRSLHLMGRMMGRSVGRHLFMRYSSAMNANVDLSQWHSGKMRKAALEVKQA
jgi:hypothetical protein